MAAELEVGRIYVQKNGGQYLYRRIVAVKGHDIIYQDYSIDRESGCAESYTTSRCTAPSFEAWAGREATPAEAQCILAAPRPWLPLGECLGAALARSTRISEEGKLELMQLLMQLRIGGRWEDLEREGGAA
jgi:hypothetical protein